MQHPDVQSPRPKWHGNTLRALSLWTALLGLGSTLGCGVEPAPEPSDNADSVQRNLTPMCISETQGGTTSCKDEKTWSTYAAMACAGKGLTLAKIGYATSCGAGLYRQTTYECCTSTPTPTPMCMWSPATGTGRCLKDDEWKKEGVNFCAMHGLQLNDLKLDRACTAGGFATAQFECCTTPPMPPGPMCTTQVQASRTCIDDATWKSRAEAECKAKMQTLGAIGLGTACMGGHLDIKFECCGPTTPPPPPPGMCTTEALRSMACVDDVSWKRQAEAACSAKKLTLGTLAFGSACMGGHQDIKFECCGPTTPPPGPMCSTESIAAASCVDDVTLKTKAEATCKAKMLTLGAVTFGPACPGGHQEIKFECCGTTTPPGPMCISEAIAVMACVDDASWKLRADAMCKAKMLTLTSISYGTACMGGHQDIKFECCGPTTPPPGPMCSTDKAPSTGMCQTPDRWKAQGDTFCAAKRQSLSGLNLNGACTGGFSEAQFICCGPTTPTPTPTCTGGVVGDGRTCSDETTLKTQASAICTMAGARLAGFSPYDLCGAMTRGYLHAKYECCK